MVDLDLEFLMVAVCCHQMDYRFCWALNRSLGLEFKKLEDYSISIHKTRTSLFSRYEYIDPMTQIKYTVLANKSTDALLAKEHAKVDYFLLLEGYYEEINQTHFLESIKKTPFVLTAFYIDPTTLYSKANFLLD